MGKINRTYLLLGCNIEPRFEHITEAISLIELEFGKVAVMSSIYESDPWGFESKTKFLNCVVLINTNLSALDILKRILEIEKSMGRVRHEGYSYASRNIDIDILYYNDEIIELPELKVPHPRMHERRFTLEPLAEIAADFQHPLFMKTNKVLLKELIDISEVTKYKAINNEL